MAAAHLVLNAGQNRPPASIPGMPESMNQPTAEPPAESESIRPRPQRMVRSEELLQGQSELLIQHGQEVYRLRLTRSGKLILGK